MISQRSNEFLRTNSFILKNIPIKKKAVNCCSLIPDGEYLLAENGRYSKPFNFHVFCCFLSTSCPLWTTYYLLASPLIECVILSRYSTIYFVHFNGNSILVHFCGVTGFLTPSDCFVTNDIIS